MISLTNLHCVQEIALCRRSISDRRGKTGAGAVAYTPAGFPHASHDVRQTPLPDETWTAHTPAGPRLFPSMLRSMFPEKLPAFRTGEPSDSQGRFLPKKQPLCVRPAHRQKGCFFLQRVRDVSPDAPGCVFLRTRSVSGTCRLRLPSSPHSRRRQAGRRQEPLLKASAAGRLPPWPCHPSGRRTACRARTHRTRSCR